MDTLNAALTYRNELGWSVIPMSRESKLPLIRWADYQKRLPTSTEIRNWWCHFPDANIGLVCGRISEVIVFDCDGQDAMDYMKEKGLAHTVEAQSSKDTKRHYYYKYPDIGPDQDFIYSNVVRVLDGTKKIPLDIRANGGLVVLPPSIHSSGVQYQWIKNPFNDKMAELDQWQFELFHRKHAKREFFEKIAVKPKSLGQHFTKILVRGSEEGQRDIDGFMLALQMRKCGFRRELVESKMKEWAARCRPPFSERETNKILKSAFQRRIK